MTSIKIEPLSDNEISPSNDFESVKIKQEYTEEYAPFRFVEIKSEQDETWHDSSIDLEVKNEIKREYPESLKSEDPFINVGRNDDTTKHLESNFVPDKLTQRCLEKQSYNGDAILKADDDFCDIEILPDYRSTKNQEEGQKAKFAQKFVNTNLLNTNKVEKLQENKNISQGDLKRFKCDMCSSKFKRRGHLTKHRRSHTGEHPYVCGVCKKKFSDNSHLRRHYHIHTGERPYKCNLCDKSYRDNSSLKSHFRVHTECERFKCDVCGKEFLESGNLKKHKRIHSGERPYKCDICGKDYSLRGTFKKHYRVHTGERPYSCTFCSKSFTISGDLKKHIRVHTGEKPYKCDVCHKAFSQRGTLKKHVILHVKDAD